MGGGYVTRGDRLTSDDFRGTPLNVSVVAATSTKNLCGRKEQAYVSWLNQPICKTIFVKMDHFCR